MKKELLKQIKAQNELQNQYVKKNHYVFQKLFVQFTSSRAKLTINTILAKLQMN